MFGHPGGLDAVDEGGDSIDSGVLGAGTELGHGEEVVCCDVRIDAGGHDFLQKLSSAFHEGDGLIRFGFGVVGLEQFVNGNHCHLFPRVDPSCEAVLVEVGES